MIHHVNVDPPTIDSFHKIREMTGHSMDIILERAIEEGVVEILAKYARNPKYTKRFQEFFPDFVDVLENERKDVIAILKDIHDEADCLMGIEARFLREAVGKSIPNIKRWVKECLEKMKGGDPSKGRCKKCGSDLDDDRYCGDETCPFRDHLQDEKFTEG